MSRLLKTLFMAALVSHAAVLGQTPQDPDPQGVLRKPIPDRLIVLTFDDAPASHATVVAPILKELGLGGTIDVCDFDSFRTRKDWYLTYRQMNAMHAHGLEIGNHTRGHASGYGPVVAMEDQVLAHGGPRMTTLCWPIYAVNWDDCPKLTAHGYTFGRGGHERAYRPTLDHALDVPSFSVHDGVPVENFIKAARQACQGRVVVFCFHGVPDMEHPPVSLEPATFRAMMQYLKDNGYQCIAMRDMAQYIDPVRAASLPQTTDTFKAKLPGLMLEDAHPYVPPVSSNIREISFPGLPPARTSGTAIHLTVPYATDVTRLSPVIRVSPDATLSPASGTTLDFSTPQTYTVTGKNGATKNYTITVTKTAISAGKEILTFTLPGALSTAIAGGRIAVTMPMTADVTAQVPAFTLSPFASAAPPSGTARDFRTPQNYIITAQDGTTRTVTVSVIQTDKPNIFTWSKADNGNWSDAACWSGSEIGNGRSDSILKFNQGAPCTARNDLSAGFQVNQIVLGDKSGGLIVTGNPLAFSKAATSGLPPVIEAGKCGRIDFKAPLNLQEDLTVRTSADKDPNCFLSFHEPISGPHALMLQSPGDSDVAGINFHDVHFGILQLNSSNTYSGGTLISGGKIIVQKPDGLGTGPVTLDHFGTLSSESPMANPLTIQQGTLFHCALTGPVTLNGIASFISDVTISGTMSGPGGFTMLGTNGTYLNMVPGGTVTLEGTCSYTGPTTVFPGTLIIKKAAGLYGADPARWTPASLTIHKAATLRLTTGGPGEFTREHLGTLLRQLTAAISNNGLMGGAILCLDTGLTSAAVEIAATISDSSGPGGGAFVFKKCGPGILQLSGRNTYSGQTILENGTLSVASLNSYTQENRQPHSSLGAPADIEAGEILFGQEDKDSDCTLRYTGSGESTDRVLNLAGKTATLTLEQSGTGLLKFTAPLLISGYGASKTIVLASHANGSGEFAAALSDPHDRTRKATTSLTKSGPGKWTLSGTNTFTGPTSITGGTLTLSTPQSLDSGTSVSISREAALELNFRGRLKVHKLTLDSKEQPAGVYSSANAPNFILGPGTVEVN